MTQDDAAVTAPPSLAGGLGAGERQYVRGHAYSRAYRRLADMYPATFLDLLAEETRIVAAEVLARRETEDGPALRDAQEGRPAGGPAQ